MSYRIIEMAIPGSAADEPTWDAVVTAEMLSALDEEIWGNDDFSMTPQQVVAGLAHQESTAKARYYAVDAAVAEPGPQDVLGVGAIWMPLHDNTTTATAFLGTRPDARRSGVGTALWEHTLGLARANGRTVLQAWTGHAVEPAADDPDAMAAPTGSGRIPASAPWTRFCVGLGASLEQAQRHSVVEVPVDPALLDRCEAQAREKAGADDGDYGLVAWSGPVPQEWVDEYCVLQTRMSTDMPMAGMEVEEEVWTEERLRDSEQALADNQMSAITVAVLHRPSGELAGYTALEIEEGKPEAVFQETTIVRSEHRGHRLGMLLKVANLRRLAAEHPEARRIHTWNAEENDYMLSINVALGFRPAGTGGAWQLKLEA